MRIVEAADLDHGPVVGGGVDELAAADVHAGVGDLPGGFAEEQQIARLERGALDGLHTFPAGLRAGVTRDDDAAAAAEHLGEAGAVVAKTGSAAPEIRNAEEALTQRDGVIDAQRLRVE